MNNIKLTYTITTENASHKMSFNPPYNIATIRVYSNIHMATFRCRITKYDEQFDPTLGVLVTESYNHDAGIQFSFDIDSTLHFLQGEGTYQVTLYTEDDDGHWNEECFFLTIGTSGSEQFVTADGFKFKTTYSERDIVSVSFEANGAKGNQNTIQVRPNATIRVPSCSLRYPGGTFTYWSLVSDPTVHYAPGDSLTVASNVVLQANWEVNRYVLFKSLDTVNHTPVTICTNNHVSNWDGELYYSTDGSNWSVWTGFTITGAPDIYMYGEGNTYLTGTEYQAEPTKAFVLGGSSTYGVGCYGNIEMLLDCTLELGKASLGSYAFQGLFFGQTLLRYAPDMPTEQMSYYCYHRTYQGCSNLLVAPDLPSTKLANWCYCWMFRACTSLTKCPVLPATELTNGCYRGLIEECTGITELPSLPATELKPYCYGGMFCSLKNIQVLPKLPATVLQTYCYYWMFASTNLNTIVKDTYSSAYPYEWRIPTEGTIESIPLEAMTNFAPKTMSVNRTYYVARKPV